MSYTSRYMTGNTTGTGGEIRTGRVSALGGFSESISRMFNSRVIAGAVAIGLLASHGYFNDYKECSRNVGHIIVNETAAKRLCRAVTPMAKLFGLGADLVHNGVYAIGHKRGPTFRSP